MGALAGARLAHAEPEATLPAPQMPLSASAVRSPPEAVHRPVDSAWWRDGVTVFAALWDDARARLTDDVPDWLHRLSRRQPAAALPVVDAAYVVLQDDRADGMDLVTFAFNDQVRLQADLRWVEFDERAALLHGPYGPVAADPVTLGISLGYRFR